MTRRKRSARVRQRYRDPWGDMMRQTTDMMKFTIGVTAVAGVTGATIKAIKK